MKHRQTTLPNGLRIISANMTDSLSVAVSIMVGTGSRYENYHVNGGVSHILEHMLFKGTKRRPTAKLIAEEIEGVGGYHNAYTSSSVTNYYVKVPAQHLELALDILSDLVVDPLIDANELDRERSVIIQEYKMRIDDDPAGQAGILAPPLIWPDNPLAFDPLGPVEVINSIPRDTVRDYWKLHYQPQNMVVTVAGKVDHDELVAQVESIFGAMEGYQPEALTPVGRDIAARKTSSVDKKVAQAQLIIVGRAYPWRSSHEAAAKMMASILGRGMSSRLFENVREQKGLAYHVSAGINSYIDTGMFEIYAGVDPEQAEAALEAIFEELKLMRDQPVTPAELQKAKNQTSGGLAMALESNSAVAERLALQTILLGTVESVEDQIARFDAVTIADIQRVAAELLDPGQLRLSVVAPDTAGARDRFEQLTGEK